MKKILLFDSKIELCSVFMSHFHRRSKWMAWLMRALTSQNRLRARELIARSHQDNDICRCVCVCFGNRKNMEKLVNFPCNVILWSYLSPSLVVCSPHHLHAKWIHNKFLMVNHYSCAPHCIVYICYFIHSVYVSTPAPTIFCLRMY